MNLCYTSYRNSLHKERPTMKKTLLLMAILTSFTVAFGFTSYDSENDYKIPSSGKDVKIVYAP